MLSYISAAAVLSLAFAVDVPSCGEGKDACPKEYPCCSAEGTCGNGYVCLGGCDPRFSHEPGSCVAMPVYEKGEFSFDGTDGIAPYSKYLGNATKNPFSYLGNITNSDDDKLRIQMYEGTGGSTVSSSHFLWYGKTTIKMKTSGGGGVISDFILLSSVKDEVDYEMVGYDLNEVQSNYYWQGQLDYKNMLPAKVSSNTEENYHEYTIDWQEDKIEWIIDGNTVRTLNKEDTKNSTTGDYAFPQTPCRIQFGLWPAGDSSAQGTREWAGGPIQWDQGQAAQDGFFYVDVESLSVEPYDPPSGVNKTGSKSYIYTSKKGLESDIAITDDDYILLATDGTGDNLGGPYHKGSSSSASSSKASSTKASSSKASSTKASSTKASSSKTSSSKASSSSASSSAQSSSASSSAPKSSSAGSSEASSGKSSSASSAGASSTPSSSASAGGAVTTSGSGAASATGGAGAGASGSASASGSPSGSGSGSASSTGSSSGPSASPSSASSNKPPSQNNGVALAIPAIAAVVPAFLL